MENPFKKNGNNADLGYRVFVRKIGEKVELSNNGNKQEYRSRGHVTHWIPETGVGVSRDEAKSRTIELNGKQSFIARLIHPNAKMVPDIVER